jgi:hypothetical protein
VAFFFGFGSGPLDGGRGVTGGASWAR